MNDNTYTAPSVAMDEVAQMVEAVPVEGRAIPAVEERTEVVQGEAEIGVETEATQVPF